VLEQFDEVRTGYHRLYRDAEAMAFDHARSLRLRERRLVEREFAAEKRTLRRKLQRARRQLTSAREELEVASSQGDDRSDPT
jgi:hypothetical protein